MRLFSALGAILLAVIAAACLAAASAPAAHAPCDPEFSRQLYNANAEDRSKYFKCEPVGKEKSIGEFKELECPKATPVFNFTAQKCDKLPEVTTKL